MNAALLGIDLGSVSAHAALLDGEGALLWAATRPTAGRPLAALVELLDALPTRHGEVRVAATGSGAHLVRGRLGRALRVNGVVATARGARAIAPAARGVIEIGGHMSRWMALDQAGELDDFALSELCAAGAGVFLEQQAGRLRMSVGELAETAAGAPRGASVAGRCTVFAKSDMIHLQQKGTPVEEISYGLCLALARNFQASVLRGRDLVLPAVLVGGGVANPGLVRALLEILGMGEGDLLLPTHAVEAGAIGAALSAAEAEVLDFGEALASLGAQRGAPRALHRFEALPEPGVPEPPPEPDGREVDGRPVILGVDVGSVSTNLVLVSEAGALLDAIYLATRGRPLEVLQEGLSMLRQRHPDGLEVVGVASTGSGRHLAGRFLGADLVRNEITAQLRGAAEVMPRIDTVFEIGGQDSKFISARDGHILDFTMNKVCAAGTGSFLEEQAERLEIDIIGQFAKLALSAEAPVDLGSRCTVFMDNELAHALREGVEVPDLAAGLALSVARNYLEKVVAGRPVGEHVLFQGGTASNRAVVAAFRQLLGRPVQVHPYNRVSGALGAALLLMDARLAREISSHTTFRGMDSCHGEVERSFECHKCSNRCQVTRFRAGGDVFFFGDTCELYSVRGGKGPGGAVPDNPLAERQALLVAAAGLDLEADRAPEHVEDPGAVLGIPLASVNLKLLPVWAAVARAAGRRPVLSRPSSPAILTLGQRSLKVDTCLPVKLAYGHVEDLRRRGVRDILLPAAATMPRRLPGDALSFTCPYTHHLPWMLEGDLLAPEVDLAAPPGRQLRDAPALAERLGLSVAALEEAVAEGLETLRGWEASVRLLGEETLARTPGAILVVLGRSYILGDAFLNMEIGRHLARLGLPFVPMDALPLEEVDLDERYANLRWSSTRDYVRAAMLVREDPRLFPVVLSSFGCGPDGFGVKHLEALLGDRPRLLLELDEHRGEAGFVTRLEAFADEIEAHQRRQEHAVRVEPPRPVRLRSPRRVVIPYVADQAHAFVGALRRAGHEVVLLPPPDEHARLEGEALSSGRECHPYVLMVGDVAQAVESGNLADGDRFFFPGGVACLFSQYTDGLRYAASRLGVSQVEFYTPMGDDMIRDWGLLPVISLHQGLVAIEYLTRARFETRPYEVDSGETDQVHAENLEAVAEAVERLEVPRALPGLLARYRAVPRVPGPRRPRIGVAGDIYTRINDFGNGRLLSRLEELGCEVWPAPFVTDTIEFGLERLLRSAIEERKVGEVLSRRALVAIRDLNSWRLRWAAPEWAERYQEPSYQQVMEWSLPYTGKSAAQVLQLNVAKMVHFSRGGAAGILNAICFGCMLGGVSAAVVDRIRADYGGIPMATLAYGGTDGTDGSARLEAFAHQARRFHERHLAPREVVGPLGITATAK